MCFIDKDFYFFIEKFLFFFEIREKEIYSYLAWIFFLKTTKNFKINEDLTVNCFFFYKIFYLNEKLINVTKTSEAPTVTTESC